MNLLADITSQQQADMTSAVLFYFFGIMSAASALGVVLSRNIVRTAVCLLFTLIGVGGLYFLLNAEFLAAVQLVVYAGGTLILIIFGVMLTSKSPFSRFEPSLVEVIIALSINLVLLVALAAGIWNTKFNKQPFEGGQYPVDKLGQALLGDFLVPFELASVLLLAVMIGAAYLAKGRRRDEGESTPAVGGASMSRRAREWS
jgi:NADH-quinone oxidoreductase subunit J